MPDAEYTVNVCTRYGFWPGKTLACWAYAPKVMDVILVADDEGRMVGQFERYRYTDPSCRLKWGRPL